MKRILNRSVIFLVLVIFVFSGAYLNVKLRIEIGITAAIISFVLVVMSRRRLGNSFSVMPRAKSLVTEGLYSKILHPMYVFLDIFLVSVIFALNIPLLLVPWTVLLIIQTLQSKKEESVLSEAFGPEYENYRNQVWM